MDKETYETYEFLPSNNVASESDQFFVVQDDGTFLITKQIQYVNQEPENKELSVNTVPVYDAQPQQYYVNVNNSTELIIPELVIPNGNSNLFTNNYLLQTEGITTTATTEQVVNVTDEYKETSTEIASESNNKSTNNCTEITLSDEQYQTLEQKGWILLESNDKIFVLNTLGLHDITTNDKLIHKLKSEIQNNADIDMESGLVKGDVIPNATQDSSTKHTTVEFVVANDEVSQNGQDIQNVCFVVGDKEDDGPIDEGFDYKKEAQSANAAIQDETIEVFREQDSNSIKIKTKFVFPNIPNKIILGKTANGKRIVAKVVKKNKPLTVYEKIMNNKQYNGSDLSESQFLALVHQALRSYSNTFYAEDAVAANAVIFQLLKLPALRQSIIDQKIILTKIRSTKDQTGKIIKSKISLITGKVNLSNNKEECFTHIPNLLHNLLLKKDVTNPKLPDKTNADNDVIENDLTIYHIHVSEVVCEDNVVRVHINLAKRQFAVDSVLRKAQTTYACGACATMFTTLEDIKQHQEGQCMETEGNLTIDIDILNKNKETYSVIKNGKEKLYSCLQCDARFAKVSHCQKHVKTHFVPTIPSKSDGDKGNTEQMEVGKEKEVYKCKMCPATFYHPSTLSRHIVTRHIKLKAN
ncbi:uncharacterized protein LOC115455809 isoform X2 [Manduca sexta]|uniref:uncharacterized protein LOC115455809 isoform X2 n=1 Tax=Manduca sexta TaxID=7130 RepID=UPI001181F884|nr:uncharacterized protein LOC115455809 isoform X2 [Manduca sexta]